MSNSLKGKGVLVTGGSAGLGAETVRKFAREGCNVVINYANNQSRADDLAEEVIEQYGIKAYVLKADLGNIADIEKLVEDSISKLGRLDIVISNAGWTRFINFADIDEVTEADWDRTCNMNIKSHFWLYKYSRKYLNEGPGTQHFIVTASIAGLRPSGSSLPYSSTKAALIHMVKGLAKVSGPNVCVNAICPGLLLTEWGLKFGPEIIANIENSLPLKHAPTISDTAEAFVYVSKSTSVTGTAIPIDAGNMVV
ncbi:hypothetical protein CANCADRAFT_46601 [Tortispora caseinolytica NRRL Y-17796]|uniref:Uncharacterized protein n=1 Tax=Tortispora caseinolytica NRRL Y-17796 TaxID=767744 RepID=A0A1E4TIR0_9ASCO|nr:hypothetical protein CANCADRAFT_46601 [Tortispora caseinolytica NRRL Y-17796]